jgi:hypothetical protein
VRIQKWREPPAAGIARSSPTHSQALDHAVWMWNLLEDAADDPLTRRRAVQVAHSLNVITELPQYVEDAVFPVGLRVAAVDAFFIHLRLLIEFLIKKPDSRHPAIHRDDYASGFNLGSVDSALYFRLDTGYGFASQHVAHFSLERLPAEESAGAPLCEYCSPASVRWRCLRGNEGLHPAHAHNRERLYRRLRAVALGR